MDFLPLSLLQRRPKLFFILVFVEFLGCGETRVPLPGLLLPERRAEAVGAGVRGRGGQEDAAAAAAATAADVEKTAGGKIEQFSIKGKS